MVVVPYAYLAVTAVGCFAVLMAYRPIRREPGTIIAFATAWIAGELAFQNIVWQAAATALFIWAGALSNWAGYLGLALAVVGWVGLVGLGVAGHRASRVVAASLDEVRDGAAFPVPEQPTAPTWGRWWRLTRAIPLKSRAVRIIRNIDYAGDGLSRHRLDIYSSRLTPTPLGGPNRPLAPVIVYVHGGAWMIGDKREQGKPMMYELVARGWICVSINYRLSPKATWPDHIVDVKRAVAWVKAHIAEYGGDPDFIAITGGSAGGHLSALAALTPNDPQFQPGFEDADTSVQAAVPFYGVYDFTRFDDAMHPMMPALLVKSVLKQRPSTDLQPFLNASPVNHLSADAPPFFVLHGRNDSLVPVEQARAFVERLRRVSTQPVAYAELPVTQHAFDIFGSARAAHTAVAVEQFLAEVYATHLRADVAAPEVS
jgi:acetyl esterase/lipase